MARRIEHRSISEWPAQRVHQALTDIDYLRDRLHEIGGNDPELLAHETTEEGTRFQVRQGVRADALPAMARSVLGGDLKIDRTESWRPKDAGHYTGEIAAEVVGAPCAITGSMWLRDLSNTEGSEFITEGSIEVNLPIIGGKLEALVAEQVTRLLGAEDRFTADWLTQRS